MARRVGLLRCGVRPHLKVKQSHGGSVPTADSDPNVWSGRASQEGSSSWLRGLASMYPASDWSSLLRAIMDISAPAI
jgi:hypothetical protein